jgi:hypothetical protein
MTMRILPYAGAAALLGQVLLFQACGGGNTASTTSSGGATGSASTGGATGTGGSTVASSSGGTTGTATGTGGTAVGGATGATSFSPSCDAVPVTAAGPPTKGGACTPTDSQLCYKTCGPQSIGFKSETCTGNVYAEMSGCNFPAGDYSCYKIPATVSATCPATPPQASMPCTVAKCTLCSVAGNYLDSSGASKIGYCVCPDPPATGPSKWSCATTTAWPCPAGQGC